MFVSKVTIDTKSTDATSIANFRIFCRVPPVLDRVTVSNRARVPPVRKQEHQQSAQHLESMIEGIIMIEGFRTLTKYNHPNAIIITYFLLCCGEN